MLGGGLEFQLADFDLTGLGIAGGMIGMLLGRAWKILRELARAEPAASRRR